MLRRTLLIVASMVIVTGAVYSFAQMPKLSDPGVHAEDLPVLMRAKLSSSQKVVEGLMSGDFGMIRKGGEDLKRICDATSWRMREDQVYAHYRAELARSAMRLVEQAKAENLDGAAYGYMHSLTTCIQCHEYCRNTLRIASIQPLPPVVSIPASEQEAQRLRAQWR
jgi:hypothetical protein